MKKDAKDPLVHMDLKVALGLDASGRLSCKPSFKLHEALVADLTLVKPGFWIGPR